MHEFIKDFMIPLLAPTVAIIVPTILFYVIPRRWQRYHLALEFFDKFNGEEMRQARLDAWSYFVTQTGPEDHVRRDQRLREFLEFLTEPEIGRRVDRSTHDVFQKTSRVLDFLAIVDGSLGRGAVDRRMLRSYLAYYYVWWREMVLEPLWRERDRLGDWPRRHLPVWHRGLPHLDGLTGLGHAASQQKKPAGTPPASA